jgi:hypothetical protein
MRGCTRDDLGGMVQSAPTGSTAMDRHAFVQIWSSLFQPGGTPEHSRSWCDQMRAATSAETALRLFQIASRTDVRDIAPKVKCPALIVHAERDMVAPIEEGRLLASLIPDSRFVHYRSVSLRHVNEPCSKPSPKDSITRRSRDCFGSRKRRSAITSPGSSTRFGSSTAIRPSSWPAKRGSAAL